MGQRAVFLDRDKTLIEDPGYISDPQEVRLLPGVGDAIRMLREAGFRTVVVSNQSGIARGLLDERTLERVHDRLRALLAEQGAHLDAIYFCPYLDGDEATDETYRHESDERKPAPGMLLRAARDLDLDLKTSWAVGDQTKDVIAGRAAGCRTILLTEELAGSKPNEADFLARDLRSAAHIILRQSPPRPAEAGSKTEELLTKVLDELRQQRRIRSQPDFTLPMLLGLIAQLAALLAAGLAVLALLDTGPAATGQVLVRLFFALWLQAFAMTMFIWQRRREGG
jgi:D-glycero-D-manno-heptose 1,7-bisphosphate phosphatase